MTAVGLPFAAYADSDTALVAPGTSTTIQPEAPQQQTEQQQTQQQPTYLPLRSSLKAVGVSVEWENKNGVQKVVLTYGSQKVQLPVDATNHLLKTNEGDFSYANIGGSLQAELRFFQAIFANATVAYNAATGGITVTAVDASQPITLNNLDDYNNDGVEDTYTYYESGQATWYGSGAHGNLTASGERFNMYAYTAAHKTLPFGTKVRVTDTDTGKSVVVTINDRGPFGAGRVIDLSYQAASDIGMISKGVANVKLEILK